MKHPKIFQNLKYFVLSASGTETSFSGMEGWLKIKLPKCLRVFKLMGCQITNKILLWLLLHFIHKKHYVLSYRYYNFSNQIIWCSVWICIARFQCHMFSLFCCAVVWIRKGVSTNKRKYAFHLNNLNNSKFFLNKTSLKFDLL